MIYEQEEVDPDESRSRSESLERLRSYGQMLVDEKQLDSSFLFKIN